MPNVIMPTVIDYQTVCNYGVLIHRSQMFNTRNEFEASIIAAMCFQEGISFLQFKRDYNVIMGNISKKADAMLASFGEMGGKKRIVEATDERVQIDFEIGEEKYTGICEWGKLIHEPFTHATKDAKGHYCGDMPIDKRPLKENYATPVKRGQMLFARCVSDSLRRICPKACAGYYTPEEVSDFAKDDNEPKAPITPAPAPQPTEPAKPAEVEKPALKQEEMAEEVAKTTADETDYTICRIPNSKLEGKKWILMDDNVLAYARDELPISQYYTTKDREVVSKILADRSNIPADN